MDIMITEDWMTRDIVHISTMLTNHVADGKAHEMIVVCPYIYCSKDMPFIEDNFSVAEDRENTAITGFSMGGRESLLLSAAEHDGVVGTNLAIYKDIFSRNGEGYLWNLMSGTGPDHSSVTPHLYNYFKMIFQ